MKNVDSYIIVSNRCLYLGNNMVFQIIDNYKPTLKITKQSFEKIKGISFITTKESIDFYKTYGFLGYYKNIPIYPEICKFIYIDSNLDKQYKKLDLNFNEIVCDCNEYKNYLIIDGVRCYSGRRVYVINNYDLLKDFGYIDSEIKIIKNYSFILTNNMIKDVQKNKYDNPLTYYYSIPIYFDVVSYKETKETVINSDEYRFEETIFNSLSIESYSYDKLKNKYIIEYKREEKNKNSTSITKRIKRKIDISKEKYIKYKSFIDNDKPGEYIYKMVFNGIIYVPYKYEVVDNASNSEYYKCKDDDFYKLFNINNLEHKGFKLNDEVFWSDSKVSFLCRYEQYLESELKNILAKIDIHFNKTSENNIRNNKIKFIELAEQYLNLDNLWRTL